MNRHLYSWYRRKVARTTVMIILCLTAGIAIKNISFGTGATRESVFCIIIVRHYGTDPEEIERTITIPLEDEIASLPGITEITSVSEINTCRITLKLHRNTDQRSFFLLLRETVASVYESFPDSVQRPEIFSSAGNSHPMMVIAFQLPAEYVEDTIKPSLKRISGIGEIQSGGEAAIEVHLEAETSYLYQSGLSISRLAELIRSSRGNTQAGFLEIDKVEQPVMLKGRIQNPAELLSLPIALSGGDIVPLGKLADLSRQPRQKDTISRLDGQLFSILYVKDSGLRSPLEISREVRKNLAEISTDCYEIIYDFGRTIETSIRDVMAAMVVSMIMSVIFLSFFFHSGNAPLILALFIPFNVYFTLGFTSLLQLPVDPSMLAGVAVGIGIICDGGIIITSTMLKRGELENIHKLFPPLVSGAVTTILAGVPLFFLPANPGSVQQMALSFMILTAVSTFTSLFFLPPLLSFRNEKRRRPGRKMVKLFWNSFRCLLSNSAAPLILGAVLTAGGIFSLVVLPRSPSQAGNESIVYGQIECPGGAGIAFVDNELQRVFSRISNLPGIERVETLARRNRGSFSVRFNPKLISRERVADSLNRVNELFTSSFLYVRGTNSNLTEIQINFIGPDSRYLKQAAGETAGMLQSLPWVQKTVLHFTDGEPGWVFKPDREKMAAAALPFRQVARELRWGLFGPVVFKWIDSEKERDVRVMGNKDNFTSIEEIKSGGVINRENICIPVQSLGSFHLEKEESGIHRLNRQRCASISLQTQLSSLKELQKKLEETAASISLKQGYGIRIDPALKQQGENYAALRFSLLAALLLVYMVLAAQYESFTAPVIIFLSIPLSLSFPLIGLLVFSRQLTPAVFIGMVMVTGLSVNNIILIVEDILLRQETTRHYCIKKNAVSALRKRISPLLLTTGSTLLGLIPLFFYTGHSSAMIRDLSLTVFSGVAGSGVASFFILPAFIIRWPLFARRLPARIKGPD